MYGQLSKETMEFFVRLSKIFDTAIPMRKFTVLEPDHVMLAGFIPSESFTECEYDFMFDTFPQSLIQSKNIIHLEGNRLLLNDINISGMTHISKDMVRYAKETLSQKTLDTFCSPEGRTNIAISGKKFKSLISAKGDVEVLFLYRDEDTSIIARGDSSGFIHYALNAGEPGEELYCTYPIPYLRKIVSMIPSNREIILSYTEDNPLSIIWKDDDGNTYVIVVAPRIENRYTRDENGKKVLDKSVPNSIKGLLKVVESDGTEIQKD